MSRKEFGLQDGEPTDWIAADAEHWVEVYSELAALCRRLLADLSSGDELAMRRRLAHFEQRLDFWQMGRPLQKVDEGTDLA